MASCPLKRKKTRIFSGKAKKKASVWNGCFWFYGECSVNGLLILLAPRVCVYHALQNVKEIGVRL